MIRRATENILPVYGLQVDQKTLINQQTYHTTLLKANPDEIRWASSPV